MIESAKKSSKQIGEEVRAKEEALKDEAAEAYEKQKKKKNDPGFDRANYKCRFPEELV